MSPLLEVRNLTLRRDDGTGSAILNSLNLKVEEGEVVIVKGESGSGKTTLLKCIAELNVYQQGEILLNGKSSVSYGIPKYRTLVQYVPQRPSMLPGTPIEFLNRIQSFRARQAAPSTSTDGDGNGDGDVYGHHKVPDPYTLAQDWGIDRVLWTREWATLSGGEGQRIALAIAVGIGGAEVVLLDEPTSALDEQSMKRVEQSLVSMLPPLRGANASSSTDSTSGRRGTGPKALVWITHEAEQAKRIGTRTIDITRR